MGTPTKGSFYEEELQKFKDKYAFLVEKIILRKKSQVLVKWRFQPQLIDICKLPAKVIKRNAKRSILK